MKVGIMQPYLFPYIGYYQLISSVDTFVIYDDVSFIKQGWINRNNLLLHGKKHLFIVPIKNSSSFNTINETYISDRPLHWERKMLETVKQAYSKAPYFKRVIHLIEEIIIDSSNKTIADMSRESILKVLDYLGVKKKIIRSSSIYANKHLKSIERVIDICIKEGATTYINAIGGIDLYSHDLFNAHHIDLVFLKPVIDTYKQFGNDFVAGLSIIDVLMFNDKDWVVSQLSGRQFFDE
jgi:hypothetical protein